MNFPAHSSTGSEQESSIPKVEGSSPSVLTKHVPVAKLVKAPDLKSGHIAGSNPAGDTTLQARSSTVELSAHNTSVAGSNPAGPTTQSTQDTKKMALHIASADRDSAILVCDDEHNDVAEFYHADQATVGQSYETAYGYANRLISHDALVKALHRLAVHACDDEALALLESIEGPSVGEQEGRSP
jgi:hypothetical protein